MLRSTLIPASEIELFAPRNWEAAFCGDPAEPSRQFAVMRAVSRSHQVPIGGHVLQCGRVFICHPARCGGKRLLVRKILES
jgi:hypothetical protein